VELVPGGGKCGLRKRSAHHQSALSIASVKVVRHNPKDFVVENFRGQCDPTHATLVAATILTELTGECTRGA
jgi:hypothetical protein